MPNNSLPFFKLFFQDSTVAVLHTVDNDVVIGLVIDSPPAKITSVFCCCFLQSLHSVATFSCTLIFWGLIILFYLFLSNQVTTKIFWPQKKWNYGIWYVHHIVAMQLYYFHMMHSYDDCSFSLYHIIKWMLYLMKDVYRISGNSDEGKVWRIWWILPKSSN